MAVKYKTYYRNGTSWMRPFINSAKGLVPIHKVVLVAGYKVPLDKIEQGDASCIKNVEGSGRTYYTISIRMYRHDYLHTGCKHFKPYRFVRRTNYDLLWTLAHELAHLKEWEHTVAHFELENKIIRRFLRVLKNFGVENMTERKPIKR